MTHCLIPGRMHTANDLHALLHRVAKPFPVYHSNRSGLHAAIVPLLVLLATGCDLPRGGLDGCGDVEFSVTPQYICPGEPVTIRWAATNTRLIPCDDFYDLGFGEGCVGAVPEPVTGILLSIPEPIFGGSTTLIRDVASDTQVVYPMNDTDIRLNVFRNDIVDGHRYFCESRTIPVFVLERDEINYHPMTFPFSCTGDDGAPGWTSIHIERGELASSSVTIYDVRNQSPFPVRLSVTRDTDDPSIPPVVIVTLEAADEPGDSTTEIDNEFFGQWSVAPLDPEAFGPSDCGFEGMAGDVAMPPGGEPPVIAPRPNIEISVGLIGCEDESHRPAEEAEAASADASAVDDPGAGDASSDAGLSESDNLPPLPVGGGNTSDGGGGLLDPQTVEDPGIANPMPNSPGLDVDLNGTNAPNIEPKLGQDGNL